MFCNSNSFVPIIGLIILVLRSTLTISYQNEKSLVEFPTLYSVDNSGYRHFNVGILLVSGTGSGFDLEKCSPAVDLALEKVNNIYLKPHRIILDKVQRSYPSCDNSMTPGLAADMRFLHNVIAFIGPACGFALEPVARLAAYWNIPIVTGLGDQPPSTESEVTGDKLLGRQFKINTTGVFGDKSKFSTLTRLSYCQCRLKLVFDSICTAFKWKHLAVVYDRTDLFSFTVGRILINGMKELDYEVYGYDIDGSIHTDMDHALTEIQAHARIIILSLQETLVREFMLKAHYKGLTKGEWAFLDVELFKNKPSETNYWQMGDKNDLDAKLAYEALLTISLLIPKSSGWKNFSQQVKTKAYQDYNYQFPDDEEVNFFIGAFYDGVTLLGIALNETLTEYGSIIDGRSIALQMWNRSFQGMTGNITIDENGDRNADYSILDMNPETGHFEVVAYYSAQHGFNKMKERKVHWPGGRHGPPPDIPPCGFLDNDPECVKRRSNNEGSGLLTLVGAIVFVFIVLIVGVAIYVYKHMKEVEQANNTRWRILPEELIYDTGEGKIRNVVDEKESSRGSLSLGPGTSSQATFVPTAIYKGTHVGMRKIVLHKKIEFTKQIISEIRQVRDAQHENVSRLIGLCLSSTDPKSTSEKWDQILIITEYCSRGSLRDVLLNGHIHLDWPFRLSLISDIVNGMSYLHSNYGPHGRLSSSKCLVDARFVVKVSDFGLHTLLQHQRKGELPQSHGTNATTSSTHKPQTQQLQDLEAIISKKSTFEEQFWTAPEHLNISNGFPTSSLKGDIYSFGIILYEVVTRSLPYSNILCNVATNSISPEEVLRRVEAQLVPPFRPEINLDESTPTSSSFSELRGLMNQCLLDSPDERPDFPLIKTILKKLMKGAGTISLVDDLLRRLEQHASHLETLVEDKTRELAQEKRRSEDLLYQVLPRQVAEQLLRGETVIPESFDKVTIYFSDIVEFTRICAKSTPIEVVDFLNNLYGTFDGILDNFDAYKVETVGDSYLVVSGCPQRNQNLHVTEISLLALAILDAVKSFEIGHLPDEQLQIRIGIHSGHVAAGVIGHRMPHYCLFGDTVNTASRMESSGLPQKIHISESTAQALKLVGGFHIFPRGEVLLKGKGVMNTYWLEGCEDECQWRRMKMKQMVKGSSESLETKVSITARSYSGSPGPGIGVQAQSLVSQFNLSNSNYTTTTICVTPAE